MNNRNSVLKIPPFLSKLFEIVSNSEYKNIITWSREGDIFLIPDLSKFCDLILPLYFKHSNFASFVRQLNMYDFHKTKYTNVEQAFQHKYFHKDQSKNYNETMKKGITLKKRKIDFDTLKKESINFSGQLEDLKKRVDTLEGKHTYLEICHTDLASKNQIIKMQLNNLIQKEKELEHLLILSLKNFSPNFFLKNSDLKYFDNVLPETTSDGTNGLIEINKSTNQKNDILNKIFKNLYNYCYLVKNADSQSNEDGEIKPAVPIPLKYSKKNENENNPKIKQEHYDNNNYTEFQNRFHNYIDNENTREKSFNNISHPFNKMIPRRTGGVQIIESDADYEVPSKQEEPMSMFEIIPNITTNIQQNFLTSKRKRNYSHIKSDINDKISSDATYKLEKQE